MKEIVIENRKAYHDYFVDETIECGLELNGNEVKSIRVGKANIKDAWCRINNREVWIYGFHISKWDTSNKFDTDEFRVKKLLMHKSEIIKLENKVKTDNISIIPLKVYFKHGRCKVLIGVCRGKKKYDKREAEAKKQATLDINRALKNHNKKGR